MMLLVRETSPLNTVWCEWPLKKSTQPVVDRRQQVEFSQLGQQECRTVSNALEKSSDMTTTKGLNQSDDSVK